MSSEMIQLKYSITWGEGGQRTVFKSIPIYGVRSDHP